MVMGALRPAHAHSLSTSFLVVDVGEGAGPALRWDLSLQDLVWSVFIDADFDGLATSQELQAARPAIARAVTAQLTVSRGGAACEVSVRQLAPTRREGHDFLSLDMHAECPRPGRLTIGGPLFMNGAATARVLLSVHRDADMLAGVLGAATPSWTEPERVSAWASFVRFIGEGVRHVAIGYDHIAFVLLLLLPSVVRPVEGRWQGAASLAPVTRDIVTIVTAFTLAHSVTLALAVTGIVVLPTRPIEVAIAGSIAVAGALNLLPRLSAWRLPLAFGFGFVHGFGFANALAEIDAAGAALLPLLAGFNIGVVLAQLGLVALVLPLIYLARGRRWYSGGVLPLGSCALGAAGVVWLVQRL
jgi:hypothetical protein